MTRDSTLIALRQANPCLTLQAVGDKYGITKERVRQVLKGAGQPTRRYYPSKEVLCLNCGQATKRERYCSDKCWHEYTHPLMECSYCGTLFRRNAKQIISQLSYGHKKTHLFCSKRCQGKWLAQHYGFKKKYNETAIRATWMRTGYGASQLARLFDIPIPSMANYLRRFRKETKPLEAA